MPFPLEGWSVRATTAIRHELDGAEIHNNESFWEKYRIYSYFTRVPPVRPVVKTLAKIE